MTEREREKTQEEEEEDGDGFRFIYLFSEVCEECHPTALGHGKPGPTRFYVLASIERNILAFPPVWQKSLPICTSID